MPSQELVYNASPTLQKFHKSEAFLRCVLGPIGSGKSVGMCWELFRLACVQKPNHDKIRKSRALIVRNTLPELETTTMRTWKDWFPPGDINKGGWGKMTRKPPYTHFLEFYPGDGTKVEMEVLFLALDKPEDVKKLLSLECSFIWFNECRELRKEIIDAGSGRVGRYPSAKDGGCTRACIVMDSNMPDDSHWIYKCAEENAWSVDEKGRKVDPENIPITERWEFWKQPSGLSEHAENLENLNQPGNFKELSLHERRKLGRGYYTRMLTGKTQEWIKVYVHGEYGTIQQGAPVYGNAFNSDFHISNDPLPTVPSGKIFVGVDCSGRHPAAIFAQRNSLGNQIQVIDEFCVLDSFGMNAGDFSDALRAKVNEEYPSHDLYFWGDPAGGFKTQNDDRTYFEILRARGLIVRASPGLRIPDRVETVNNALGKINSDGKPYLLISPKCKHLIRGFNGGYRYKKLNVSGDDRYEDKPEKNRFSDAHDALQYMLCGMGEYNKMRRIGQGNMETYIPEEDAFAW